MTRPSVLSTKLLDAALLQLAEAQGIDIKEHEFITVEPLVSPEKKLEIEEALLSGTLVFTSANAVAAVAANQVEITSGKDRRIFCLSGRTQNAVQQLPALGTIAGTADNAAALARMILDQRIAALSFFCGNRRRDVLPDTLRAKEVAVREVVVYETQENAQPLSGSFDGVLFFSPSAVESFFACNQLSLQAVCFAVGATTANAIKSFVKNKTIVAASAGQEQVVASVIQYFNQAQNT